MLMLMLMLEFEFDFELDFEAQAQVVANRISWPAAASDTWQHRHRKSGRGALLRNLGPQLRRTESESARTKRDVV